MPSALNDAYRHMQSSGVSPLNYLAGHLPKRTRPRKAEASDAGRDRARLCANTAIASPKRGPIRDPPHIFHRDVLALRHPPAGVVTMAPWRTSLPSTLESAKGQKHRVTHYLS